MSYTAVVRDVKRGTCGTIMEWSGLPRFTKSQFDICLAELFFAGCVDSDRTHDTFKVEVYHSDLDHIESAIYEGLTQAPVIEMLCETYIDGSSVWADISVNGTFLRHMNIAC